MKEPAFIVPISFILLGLVFVPFALWKSDKAAEFYGSAFSALATIVAVFAAAYLTKQNQQLDRHEKMLTDAVDLYWWLHQATARTGLERRRLEDFVKKAEDKNQPTLKLGKIRNSTAPFRSADLTTRISQGMSLPAEQSIKVLPRLLFLANQQTFEKDLDKVPDTATVSVKSVKALIIILQGMQSELKAISDALRPFLLEQNIFEETELSSLEKGLNAYAAGSYAYTEVDSEA